MALQLPGVLRVRMRDQMAPDLTVAQFRVLLILHYNRGVSLTELAECLGNALPSVSKMIDLLVSRDLVARETSPADRRFVTLSLTDAGETQLGDARHAIHTRLAEDFEALSTQERETVLAAMAILRNRFEPVLSESVCSSETGDEVS